MTQWSRQSGVRIGWHAVTKIEIRPEQPNPNLVYAACGRRFPEIQTVDTVPSEQVEFKCKKCLAAVGG